jgi:quercetin dioxygenase-like cupin family protein/DNA-binding transcriptional regulator YiaG
MPEDKNATVYEVFREVVDEYSDQKGHDLLTDPAAVAAAQEKVLEQEAVTPAQNLRAAREKQGFSIQELSQRTGIAQRELEQVEAGQIMLPLGQVIKLSKVLSLKMADMISVGDKAFTIVRAGERSEVQRFGKAKQASHGYEYVSLAPGKKDRLMEPFLVTLHPASSDEPSSHDGQEFIYVLDGEMEVIVDDNHDILKPGDSIYYDSSTTHLVRAHGNKPAQILAVLIS